MQVLWAMCNGLGEYRHNNGGGDGWSVTWVWQQAKLYESPKEALEKAEELNRNWELSGEHWIEIAAIVTDPLCGEVRVVKRRGDYWICDCAPFGQTLTCFHSQAAAEGKTRETKDQQTRLLEQQLELAHCYLNHHELREAVAAWLLSHHGLSPT